MRASLAMFGMAALCFAVAIMEPRGREPDIPESMCWTLAVTCSVLALSEAIALIRSRRR
ncbi:hypothetical protein J0H33_10240 [bacterium]|jgi:hypothetical protein|nr:hypothetical protein [bacterium]